jgi:WD40 repeat protein
MAQFLKLFFCGAVAIFAAGMAVAQGVPREPILVLDAAGHTAQVKRLHFTPDGRELITVSQDKTIRCWDVQSGELLRTLRPPIGRGLEGMLSAAALSPDGRTLAVGGIGWMAGGQPIYLIALPSGKIQRTLLGHTGTISALAFSPDGRELASASYDRSARLWDVGTGRSRKVLWGHGSLVCGVAFSPDGSRLATASYDHTAAIWSVAEGRAMGVLRGHKDTVTAVAWSPDGRTIATSSFDKSVAIWNADGTLRQHLTGLGNFVWIFTFTADSSGLLMATSGNSGVMSTPGLLDLATGRPRIQFTQHNNTIFDGVFSPDGTLVATAGGDDQEVYLWRTADATTVHHLVGKGRCLWSCGWGPDGQTIAFGNSNPGKFQREPNNRRGPLERAFRIADLEFAAPPDASFRRAQETQGPLVLAPLGTWLTVKSGATTVSTLWLNPAAHARTLCFTFLSQQQAAVGNDFGLFVVDALAGKILHPFRGHTGTVWAIAPSPDGRYLLSASDDQTLRIWDPDKYEPLLSLFFAGDEWVAWTPEGYYAASPGGERLMGWHVNNGAERMASFFPAAQFRKSLYRPDLIKLVLRSGGTERALEQIAQEHGRPSQATRVEQVLPPKVVITSPGPAALRVTGPMLEVKAQGTPAGADPISALRLLVDGRPYEGQKPPSAESGPSDQASQSWSVLLTPGTHRIMVKAETAKSYGLSDPLEVTYEVDQSSRQPPALYVLAVGVSAYEDKRLTLSYGALDAQGLAEALQKSSGPLYRKVEAKVLVDAQATQRNILRGLEWLKAEMTQHDVGIFFYAGHGTKDANGLFYLVPADCGPDDVGVAGISADQIKRCCQATPGRLLLLLDACHTGALGGDKRRGVGGLTDDLLRDLVTDDYGVIVMCSSMGREESQEQDSWGHGAFTKALIEGLQGAADYDRDGTVYLNELDLYVTERVKTLTGGKQHPVTEKPTTIRSFPLAKPWSGLKPPDTTPR